MLKCYLLRIGLNITGGLLTTASGLPVLGNAGPITMPPSSKIEIANDGTISVLPSGQSTDTMVTLDRLKLVNPDTTQMRKGIDGLFRYQGEDEVLSDGDVHIVSGTLESSNVNPIDALVNMISLTRQYEVQMKIAKALEDNDSSSAQIMQVE